MVMDNRLDKVFQKVMEELQSSINQATIHLREGILAYLSNNIDIRELLKMVEGMGIPNIAGILQGNIPGFDPYKILGLEKTATNEEVKERYHSLLHKLHPDTSGVKGTEFLTQMIVTAYNIIARERQWK